MSDDRFDAIIVGAGLAGSTAALTLAKAGMEVLVVERGNWAGAKNVSGGRLYGHALEKIIPGFASEAPIERKITKERISLMTETAATTIEYNDEDMRREETASYSVLRSKFDKWLAEKAEAEGAMFVTGIHADEMIVRDGKVCGVKAGDEEMEADVVILADGVNSPLAQSLGMKKELAQDQTAVGVKEVIGLDEKVISDRFGVAPGEGCAWMMAGFPSDGGIGGACLYTNKDSLSLAVVLTASEIGNSEYSVPQLLERVKQHPTIAPLIEDGKLLEYSAHLVTEGGYNMIPTLYRDGVLLAGDAANMVINIAYTVRGMDFAIESGRLAAETIIKAKEKGDFSASTLSSYKTMLDNSFVMRDMMHHARAPKLMEHKEIFTKYPVMAKEVFSEMFTIDGNPRRHLMKFAMPALKKSGGIFKLAGIGMDALKAL
ncbi:MAG: FAD-dependent oxidoreductase [Lachnospiraceae bacterium]|nr:FAD-dependent oxidoreductase [Lachnospiraceae bacterium]